MNAERLHAVVISLCLEMEDRDIPNALSQLINALQQVINQAHPQHQQALAQALKSFNASLTDVPSNDFSPAWRQLVAEIKGDDLVGKTLKQSVEDIFSRNHITPAVALQELKELHERLQNFNNALDGLREAFKYLGIGDEKLIPGDCEVGILVPRVAVENKLLKFADELSEIAFILNTFSEVVTGRKDDLAIRTISSSDLLVNLQAAAPYAACVAVCVERVVALYKQLLEIRRLHLEIRKQGVPDTKVSGIEEYANNLMKGGIEKIVVDIMDKYCKATDEGRKNELSNSVSISLNKLANRIDHGYNIEVRVEPFPDSESDKKPDKELLEAVASIREATANMQFMKLEGQPLLQLPENCQSARPNK